MTTLIELAPGNLGAGLLCNDMWGFMHRCASANNSLWINSWCEFESMLLMVQVRDDDLLRHFNKWHDGFLWMSAFSCGVPILTVDSCTPLGW